MTGSPDNTVVTVAAAATAADEETLLVPSQSSQDRILAKINSQFERPSALLSNWLKQRTDEVQQVFLSPCLAQQTILGSSVVKMALTDLLSKVLEKKNNPLFEFIKTICNEEKNLNRQEILNIVVPRAMNKIVEQAKNNLKGMPQYDYNKPDDGSLNPLLEGVYNDLDANLKIVLSKYHGDQTYAGWMWGRVRRNPLRSLGMSLILAGVTWNILLNRAPVLDEYQDSNWIMYPTIAFGLGLSLTASLSIWERCARQRRFNQAVNNPNQLFFTAISQRERDGSLASSGASRPPSSSPPG